MHHNISDCSNYNLSHLAVPSSQLLSELISQTGVEMEGQYSCFFMEGHVCTLYAVWRSHETRCVWRPYVHDVYGGPHVHDIMEGHFFMMCMEGHM